ncbi:methionine--tRNA ligase [Candidatus Roizmanbacteria bacterium]|nr:methionine--tRNA ligase [Candidatus Roizmanbacteria bacterium]
MDTVSFQDFQKLDIRIGTVKQVTLPEGSKKLYRIEVDCGEELGSKIIFSGIKEFYTPEELLGKQIVVLLNLEPREFFGEKGQGMLLAADENGTPFLLHPDKTLTNGSKVR